MHVLVHGPTASDALRKIKLLVTADEEVLVAVAPPVFNWHYVGYADWICAPDAVACADATGAVVVAAARRSGSPAAAGSAIFDAGGEFATLCAATARDGVVLPGEVGRSAARSWQYLRDWAGEGATALRGPHVSGKTVLGVA